MMLKTIRALAACAALSALATPAPAEPAADAPTPTQDARTAGQIATYLATSPAQDTESSPTAAPRSAPAGDAPLRDGRVHGVAEVSLGSHGYRSVYLETHMPLGQSGELAIAIGDSRGGRFAPGLGPGFGPGARPGRGSGGGLHARLAPCPDTDGADGSAAPGEPCARATASPR